MWAGKVCVVTFLEVLKNEIQNLFSDDILSEVIGLVGWQKEWKSLKVEGVEPLLQFCGGVLIIVRKECGWFEALIIKILDLE